MAGVSADLELAIDQALAQVDALEARLAEATAGVSVDLTAEVDTGQAEADLAGLSVEPLEVDVTADTSSAEAGLESLDATPVEVEVEANTAAAQASLGELASQASEVQEAAGGASGGLIEAAGAATVLGQAQSGASASGAGLVTNLLASGSAATTGALGYGALAGGVLHAVDAYGEAQGVLSITDQIIANQGANAFTTAEGVSELAGQIQSYSGFSDEAIATGANFLLTLGNIRNEAGAGNDVFDRTVALSADLARRMGADVPAAANALGRALTDPERGLSRLERSIGRLPDDVRENILAFAEQGDTLSAQTALLDALEAKVGGVAEAYGETVPGEIDRAKEAFGELEEQIGSGVAPAFVEIAELAGPAARGLGVVADAADDLNISLNDVTGPLGRVTEIGELIAGGASGQARFNEEATAARDWGEALDQLPGIFESVIVGTGDAEGASDDLTGSMEDQLSVTERLTGEVDGLREALDNLTGAQQSVDEGAIDVRNQQRDLLEALVDLDGTYRAGTESGDAFLSTAQDLALAIRDQTLRVLESGAGADAARIAQAGYIDGLRRTLRQAGLTERQIDDLIDTFARVPDEQITKFDTPGASAAAAAAQNVKRQVDAIPNSKHIEITIGSNIGSVAGQIFGQLNELEVVAANLFRSGDVNKGAPPRGGTTVNITQYIDARGSRDAESVAAGAARGAESGLRALDARVSVKLAQP